MSKNIRENEQNVIENEVSTGLLDISTGEIITEPVIGSDAITMFKNPAEGMYVSFVAETPQEKIMMFNAINKCDSDLTEHVNEIIKIKDVIAHKVTLTDMNTKKPMQVSRLVIIDTDNKTYQSFSEGIVSSISRLMSIFGQPTWEDGIAVKIVPVKTKNKFTTYILEAVI